MFWIALSKTSILWSSVVLIFSLLLPLDQMLVLASVADMFASGSGLFNFSLIFEHAPQVCHVYNALWYLDEIYFVCSSLSLYIPVLCRGTIQIRDTEGDVE